jgi:hypothetical protein
MKWHTLGTVQWPGLLKFKSTTIPRAFVTNSLVIGIAAAVTAVLAVELRDAGVTKWVGYSATVVGAMATAFSVYWLVHFLLGYGGGMLTVGASTSKDGDS